MAKLLLRDSLKYLVRASTCDLESENAEAPARLGAEVVEVDLTRLETLPAVIKGCWGVFGFLEFYNAIFDCLVVCSKLEQDTDLMFGR